MYSLRIDQRLHGLPLIQANYLKQIFIIIKNNYFLFLFFRAHEEWGYCQAGTSALITEDQVSIKIFFYF